MQLSDFVIELTDRRSTGKLGTCKTWFKDRDGVQFIVPQPIIAAVDPSAMRTLSLPERGVYDEKRLEEPVMWFVAPESIIQDVGKTFVPFPE
jgi:hypothetical protein